MDKIKTVKIKNPDGSISEETYTISVDARNVDMDNGKDLQDIIGNIDVDKDGSIADQLKKYKNYDEDIETLYTDVSNLESKDKNLENDIITLQIESIKKKAYYFDTVADMKAANLSNGDYACTLGYYKVNDGGAGRYRIRNIINNDIIDNMFIIEITNDLVSELIIDNNTVNILTLGAKKDDINFNNAIVINEINKHSYNCFIPEGNYYISNTVFINVEKGRIYGNTSKTKLIVNNLFDGTEILFVYSENGDYYTKSKRQETIENLCLCGTETQDKTINGIKIGGDTGSSKEGHIDLLQFNNIYLYKCDKSLYFNSHAYKINFYNVVCDDSNYSIYCDEEQYDSNEATNFIGCAL